MKRFDDKVVLITGGAQGIGLAAAKKYLEENGKVMLVDIDEEKLKEARDTLANGSNERIDYVVADVSNEDDVKNAVKKTVEKYGSIDALLSNAGIEGDVKAINEYDQDAFDKIIDVNVKGTWYVLRHTMPEMEKRNGGSIVISSSVAGMRGMAGLAPYVTSKHAIVGMMKSAALEGAKKNIRVNTVNPSPVETRMMRSIESNMGDDKDAAKDQFKQMIPMGRYAEPEEIADLMFFLTSDESKFITGGIHAIDGGMTASL